MKAADVCRMREAFLEECRRQNYVIPPASSPTSALRGVGDLGREDVIDESALAGRTAVLQENLERVERQISQLCQQLKCQLFTKGFLAGVHAVLCGDRACVNQASKTDLGRQVTEINKSLLAVAVDAENVFQLSISAGQDTTSPTSTSVDLDLSSHRQSECWNKQQSVIGESSVRRKSDAVSSSVLKSRPTRPGDPKPQPASRSKSSQCVSRDHFTIKSQDSGKKPQARFRPKSSGFTVSELQSDRPCVSDRTVDISKTGGDNVSSEQGLDNNLCSSDRRVVSENSRKSCTSASGGGTAPMIDEYKDDEDPYDNVISYEEHVNMFRRKKSNASRAGSDLERSNTLSSKDNFLAVTSKHVSPPNIPRHNESATHSPHLGRHFQMLKMTTGFDFVLDGSGDRPQQTAAAESADDIHAPGATAGQTEVDSELACAPAAKNRLSAGQVPDLVPHSNFKDYVSISPTPECDQERGNSGEPSETSPEQCSGVCESQPAGRGSVSVPAALAHASTRSSTASGPENAPAPHSPTSGLGEESCELPAPTTHADAASRPGAHAQTSQALAGPAAAVTSAESVSASRELRTGESAAVPTPRADMDSSPRQPSVPMRHAPPPPPAQRTAVRVPPPVAKRPVRPGSGKKPLPLPPGAKSALKASTSSHAELSTSSNTHAEPGEPRPDSRETKTVPKSLSTPLIAKSSETEAATAGRRESVKGIAALFNFTDSSQSQPVANVHLLNTANKSHRELSSPQIPARKRVSESNNNNNNTTDNTQVQHTTSAVVETAEVDQENSSSHKDREGCVTDDQSRTDNSAIQTGVRHSVFAADAVAWPSGLAHPDMKSLTDAGEQEGQGGVGELVARTNSSLVSIHSRLLRGDTVPKDTEQAESEPTPSEPCAGHAQSALTEVTESSTQKDVGDFSQEDGHVQTTEMWSGAGTASDGTHHKPYLDSSASFTSDPDVKDAIFSLDAIIKSEQAGDDTLERTPSLRLSTASSSSVASAPRSSSSPSSPVSLRRDHELTVGGSASSRRKSSTASYENWTINRAVTRLITSTQDFDSVSDDDDEVEEDGLSEEGVASPCLMKRDCPAKGSKDSGLCDDISLASESGHVTAPASTSSRSASETGGVGELADGRVRDLKVLQLMEQCAEEEEEEEEGDGKDIHHGHSLLFPGSTAEQDMDSISVASDILFIPGSRGGSRIRKFAADQEQLPEEEDEEQAGQGEDGVSTRQQHQQEEEEAAHARISSSSTGSPECQRAVGAEVKSRLSREMSDSISMASSGEDEEPHSITMDSSYDETDSAREGMLKMRQLLVKGVLDSEKVYLDILTVLINYKKLLETNSASTQPVISRDDVNSIFSDIETIYQIHSEFVTSLEPKVRDWHHEESIGEIFKIMISKFIEFGNYLTNYQQAVSTIHRCSQGNEQFQELAQKIVVTSTVKEVSSLEDALFKPVQRVQRNTLVLHDLIKYTPQDHPDHDALQKALKLSHHILETFATAVPKSATTQENRRLVKSSFLVELVNGVRKLRYVFLFSDLIVCTKRETHRNNKVTFEPKWFSPLSQASFDTKFDYTDDTKHTQREDIDQLKLKIRALKKELRGEMKKFDDKDKHRSLVSLGGATRVVDKLRKKISQYEAQLILASPKLPFKVSLDGGKIYTLLMTTDYEREEWKETIRSLRPRTSQQAPVMSSIFVQDLINSVKETPQVNKIGSVLLQKDEDILSGTLNVTIHKMNGLSEDCDTYCCLEMDSFGHFFMKARTHICEGTRDPAWNEDFELELESSQTLRFLCFKRGETGGDAGDTMLGRGALELSKQWLKGSFQEKTVSMNEISLVVSVRHTPAEKTMQRVPSRISAAVFGVKIASCARREGKTVPTIVTACLQEVEKRGLDEVGIYRVSGVTSELQRIKKLFDKNIRGGAASLGDVDIHAVTGIVKLYFRELPEPLFTEICYQNFIDTLKLQDEEAKAQCMLSLLHGLPDTNYYTIVTLMEHLIKVARNVGENKMSIHNLSTIFGPTLLAPASKQTSSDPLEMMCKGAEQVLRQSGVINYLLGLAVSGRSLRRSA